MHFDGSGEKLSELISEIYDAALDPSLWSDVAGRAARFVGGSTAAIFSKDPVAGSGNVCCGMLDDDETRRRMRLIAPHIRQAVLIGSHIGLGSAEAATLADTLDGLSAGMCLVDAAGHIVHANAACQALLDAGDFLTAIEGRLVARDPKIDQALRELFAAAARGDAASGAQGIAVSLRAWDGSRYVAHVLPLTSGARRRAGIAYSATAALFLCKVATEIPSSPDVIARAYNLTPTELRVLLAIVEVGGVPDVATALGVAESTVKTHLSRLFVKTGAARQADLVKIVAGFATPLVD